MFNASIDYFELAKQVVKDDMRHRFGLIYCPMCQDFHENNTNCQRND